MQTPQLIGDTRIGRAAATPRRRIGTRRETARAARSRRVVSYGSVTVVPAPIVTARRVGISIVSGPIGVAVRRITVAVAVGRVAVTVAVRGVAVAIAAIAIAVGRIAIAVSVGR